MDLKIGDIQETALITLAIRASETDRPNARIKDSKAKEIIETLGIDVSKYDPFMSHEGVVARTIMYKNELEKLIKQYPDALCINLGCGFDDKFVQVDNGEIMWVDVDLPDILSVRRKIYHDRDRCVMKEGSASFRILPAVLEQSAGGISMVTKNQSEARPTGKVSAVRHEAE